jgi:hypothetical protein
MRRALEDGVTLAAGHGDGSWLYLCLLPLPPAFYSWGTFRRNLTNCNVCFGLPQLRPSGKAACHITRHSTGPPQTQHESTANRPMLVHSSPASYTA